MTRNIDKTKTLQQLEDHDWGEPTFESHLVLTCHRLRQKRLADITAEDLRIMIGQEISLPFLVPLALEKLEDDPFTESDFYPGDLLAAILRVDDSFWNAHPDLASQTKSIIGRARASLIDMDEIQREFIAPLLMDQSCWFSA